MAMAAEVPKAMCRYYATSSGCRYGDQCWFRHGDDAGRRHSNPGSTRMCRFFMSPKGCRFGSSCHFRHITPDTDGQSLEGLSNVFSSTLVLGNLRINSDDINSDTEKSFELEESGDPPVQDDVWEEDEDDDDDDEEDESNNGEMKTVVCGECHEELTSANIKRALSQHYLTKFQQWDKRHTQFISQDWRFYRQVMCDTCFIFFNNSLSMFRHISQKSKLNKRDGPEHLADLRSIVKTFVRRDMGKDGEMAFQEILLSLLTQCDVEEQETEHNSLDFQFFGRPLRQTSTLERAKEKAKLDLYCNCDEDDDGLLYDEELGI